MSNFKKMESEEICFEFAEKLIKKVNFDAVFLKSFD